MAQLLQLFRDGIDLEEAWRLGNCLLATMLLAVTARRFLNYLRNYRAMRDSLRFGVLMSLAGTGMLIAVLMVDQIRNMVSNVPTGLQTAACSFGFLMSLLGARIVVRQERGAVHAWDDRKRRDMDSEEK